MSNYNKVLTFIFFICHLHNLVSQWVSKEVASWAIAEFDRLEFERSKISHKGADRRVSYPFITGDGFREMCHPHICEDHNRCRFTPESVKDGECIFVKADFFEFFGKSVVQRIPGKYRVISHNGDLSVPDGQSDIGGLGLPRYVTSDILQKEYENGRLISLHSQNLWWVNITKGDPKPQYAHCLPIGFENRQYKIGRNIQYYANALKENIINKPNRTLVEKDQLPLLLVAFYPKRNVPDRTNVLKYLGALPPSGQSKPINPFYNETDLSHSEWLSAITEHKFVLAPFGHGLDTHRISEILLMGGIPVTRKSGITSCYDDSDNNVNNITRGSLPIVVLDSWKNLTKEYLESEWIRISRIPTDFWDYKRLFIDSWMARIGNHNINLVL